MKKIAPALFLISFAALVVSLVYASDWKGRFLVAMPWPAMLVAMHAGHINRKRDLTEKVNLEKIPVKGQRIVKVMINAVYEDGKLARLEAADEVPRYPEDR